MIGVSPRGEYGNEAASFHVPVERKNADVTLEGYKGADIAMAFEKIGLPLSSTLSRMLNEDSDYRPARSDGTSKTAGGFLEATRYLALVIKDERDFGGDMERLFDMEKGKFAQRAQELGVKTREITRELVGEENIALLLRTMDGLPGESGKMMGKMLHDILEPVVDPHLIVFERARTRLSVGSCTSAEHNFLEAAHGEIHDGAMLFDNSGELVAWQKEGRGEPTFITFREVIVSGVRIPKGSILQLTPRETRVDDERGLLFGKKRISASDVGSVRFLRVSLLGISPLERMEISGALVKFQESQGSQNPATATLDQLESRVRHYAAEEELEERNPAG